MSYQRIHEKRIAKTTRFWWFVWMCVVIFAIFTALRYLQGCSTATTLGEAVETEIAKNFQGDKWWVSQEFSIAEHADQFDLSKLQYDIQREFHITIPQSKLRTMTVEEVIAYVKVSTPTPSPQ